MFKCQAEMILEKLDLPYDTDLQFKNSQNE